jgi:type IV pilus assembly protein PilC
MASFSYSAQNSEGKMITGAVEAVTREAALSALTKQKLKPVSITEAKESKGFKLPFGGKVKTSDLVIFTRQLSTMVSAGVPLLRALSTLGEQSESPVLRTTLTQISKDVQSGMSLGDAFEKHPKVFSDVYINMVKAGEAGGILDDILKRLAIQQEKNDSIRKKVKSAMTYPMVLIVITIGAFFGLMFFVIPQIGKILLDLGGPDAKLPAITVGMLAISHFMVNYWYVVIIGIGGSIAAVKWYLSTPSGRSQFHHLIIKTPAVGPIIKKVAVARFARTYASLVGAGVSILEALRVTGEAIGNDAFREALEKGANDVKSGKQLSASLAEGKMFPGIVPQMLSVGEETGQTDVILVKVADFYEEEVDAAIASISSIIEPVMIVVMGGMVGLIAVSVMGPIASLSQNIKG